MHKRNVAGLICFVFAVLVLCPYTSLLAATGTENGAAGTTVAAPTMADEVSALKDQLEEQKKQIEKLTSTLAQQQQLLDKALNAQTPGATSQGDAQKVNDLELVKGELEAVADSAAQANQRLTKIENDTTAYTKSNDAKVKQLGVFAFSGDLRARFEPFFQEGAADRNRERIRLRFNMTGKISDEFTAGFSLATGTLDDPVSTNQTFTGFLNRKSIGIDKAYISYKPKYAKFLKLDAGKFSYPWYRTTMTFDNDINPEGFAQTLSFDVKSSSSPLKNITFVGFQLPINEVSGGPDSFILGGQIQTQFRLSSRVRLALYGAGINFIRTDPLGIAAAARTSGVLVGSLNNSNTLRKNPTTGAVLGYASKFAYLDAIMKLDLDTNPRFPTSIVFDFVNNVRGPRERSGYWTEVTFGRQKEVKDLLFGYTYARIEKDAVISAFNDSDLRASTNLLQHRMQIGYMFHGNIQGQFTAWVGKLANPLANTDLVPAGVRGACTGSDVSACRDPYLKRLQFDLIYKF
jgi:hypothetical protein